MAQMNNQLAQEVSPRPAGTPRLIRLQVVCDRTGLSKSVVHAMWRSKQMPPPVRLSARTIAWRESDIDAFIHSRPYLTPPEVS